MRKKIKSRNIQIVKIFLFFGLLADLAFACHASPPMNLIQQNGDGSYLAPGATGNGSGIRLRGQATGSTGGCGPYFLEFEVIPINQSYSGNHNYTSPGDNRDCCPQNIYQWTNINNLTSGVTYKWRVREFTSGSGARSNWTEFANPAFTVTGFGNSAPMADAQSVTVNEDETQTITLTGSDTDGDALTFALGSNPSNGTISQTSTTYLDFDGNNDYLSIANPSGIPSGNDPYTISAWIKPNSMGTRGIVGWGNWGSGNRCNAVRLMGNNKIRHYWWGNDLDVVCGDLTGTWHHIVALYDGTTRKVFLDGNLLGSDTPSGHNAAVANFRIGSTNNGEYFNGLINEVSVWDIGLTQSQIQSIMNDGLNGSEAGLVGYWDFNEGSGSSVTDLSGNGNDCTINGASWITEGNTEVITYTPNANYNGSDSFTFTASDGSELSFPATISITVNPVNDLPLITSSPSLDALENSNYEYSISVNDIDGDLVSVSANTKPDWLALISQYSGSLDFDGSNDQVNVPGSVISTDEFTFETWVYPHNLNGWRAIRNEAGWGSGMIHYQFLNSKLEFSLHGNSPTDQWFSPSFQTNTWTHLAIVYEAQNNRIRLYVDGVFIEDKNYSSTRSAEISNFQFGNWANGRPFDGLITDFRIWDHSRSETQIQENMNIQLTGDEAGLVGYWKFDEGTGSTLTDHTSNGNDGSIAGANWSSESAFPSYTILSGTPAISDGGLHNVVLTADDNNGGSVSQSFTLAVSVQSMEITGESGFRMMSSPASGAIYGDLLEELWTQGAEGSDQASSNPNIWTYHNGWNPVTDFNSDELTAGQGFLIYVFADTDFDGEDDLPVTISIDSTQYQSAVTVVSEPSEWNLIGNPYGLSVDINQMLSDNNSKFNSTVYVLDRTNPGYKTHNGNVGDIQEGLIKPFDGFWIQADTDGDEFEFTEQSIRKGNINVNGRSTTDDSNGSATFTFTNGTFSSSVFLSFTADGHINLDPSDADRLVPLLPAEHLTSMIYESGKSLSINNLPFELSNDFSFPMDVMLLSPSDNGYETQSGQVDFSWDITNLPAGMSLTLHNNVTGQQLNLYDNSSSVISIPSKGGFESSGSFMITYPEVGQSQFTLSLYSSLASTDDEIIPDQIVLHSAYPNPFNPSTLIGYDLPQDSHVTLDIYDITGRQVKTLINGHVQAGKHEVVWHANQFASGIYLVKLVTGEKIFNQKITYLK